MSEFVVHLTHREALAGILSECFVRPSKKALGAFLSHTSPPSEQCSACFSEIPLDFLDRIAERQGRWGVGLAKRTIVDAGGARVWYLDRESPVQQAKFQYVKSFWSTPNDCPEILKTLAPFIDVVQEDKPGQRPYQFDWEREWRVPGGLSFDPSSVRFLVVPEDAHVETRSRFGDFNDHYSEVPMLDVSWTDERFQSEASRI